MLSITCGRGTPSPETGRSGFGPGAPGRHRPQGLCAPGDAAAGQSSASNPDLGLGSGFLSVLPRALAFYPGLVPCRLFSPLFPGFGSDRGCPWLSVCPSLAPLLRSAAPWQLQAAHHAPPSSRQLPCGLAAQILRRNPSSLTASPE